MIIVTIIIFQFKDNPMGKSHVEHKDNSIKETKELIARSKEHLKHLEKLQKETDKLVEVNTEYLEKAEQHLKNIKPDS
jgi:hypothetical protein